MLITNASSFCPPPTQVADWAITEFGHAELGDDRRTDRLLMIATAFAQQPTAPLPQACGPGPATQGAYRFFENEAIDPEAIRDAHQQATLERLRHHSVVLALQDTSTLNYSPHPQTEGLGPIGTRRQKIIGLLLHSTLAVTPSGLPLGMLHTAVWARDPKAAGSAQQRHAKPITEKESHQWLDSLSACQQVASQCPETLLVNVADREGDLYDLFAQALAPTDDPRVHLLIRSKHNRRLVGDERLLWDAVGRQRSSGPLQVRVGRRGEQPARLTTLAIRFRQVTLVAPQRPAGQPPLPPLTLWAIEARELRPPKGATPIRWRLLTTLPVTCVAEAGAKVGWYAQRWQIEVIHKVLKSGCQIEQRQLETAARLERALAVDQVVAWRLLALCKAAREQPEAPVSAWLAQAEWEALWCHVHQRITPPKTPPSVQQAVRWTAQLGGFMARKGDGEPGPLTLWRGLHRLNDLTAMWRLCHGKKRKERCAQ
jgi:hypothetical protein